MPSHVNVVQLTPHIQMQFYSYRVLFGGVFGVKFLQINFTLTNNKVNS